MLPGFTRPVHNTLVCSEKTGKFAQIPYVLKQVLVWFHPIVRKDSDLDRYGANTLVGTEKTERFARSITNDVFSAIGVGVVPPHGRKDIFLAELIVNEKFPFGKFMDLITRCTKSI